MLVMELNIEICSIVASFDLFPTPSKLDRIIAVKSFRITMTTSRPTAQSQFPIQQKETDLSSSHYTRQQPHENKKIP